MKQTQKLPENGRVGRGEVEALGERFHHRGRGAVSNHPGRFEARTQGDFDDGWGTLDDGPPPLETTITKETPRKIITFNRSPDIAFDRTVNPYRGCEHGCVYCFARPTHAYHGLSAGLDFESKLFFKPDAPQLLEREISKPGYVVRPIALGMNTDAYQPIERRLEITRQLLTVLSRYNHPVTVLTKSALVQRDIDLLAPMAARGIVRVGISITTLDRKLCRAMEPRAASPHLRLQTVRALNAAGIHTAIMMAPIIPALNEPEIETLLEAAADHGAKGAGYVLLRLPHELKDVVQEWFVQHYPDRAARIINTLREMRGGKDYDSNWFVRGSGIGERAKLIGVRFRRTARKFGLLNRPAPLRTDLFCPPAQSGDQMDLGL